MSPRTAEVTLWGFTNVSLQRASVLHMRHVFPDVIGLSTNSPTFPNGSFTLMGMSDQGKFSRNSINYSLTLE